MRRRAVLRAAAVGAVLVAIAGVAWVAAARPFVDGPCEGASLSNGLSPRRAAECGKLRGATEGQVRGGIGYPDRTRRGIWHYDLDPLVREGMRRQRLDVKFSGGRVESTRIRTLPETYSYGFDD
jgi:hypothetical protein